MPSSELYDQDSAFWDQYLKARPSIPDSFFNRIFAYHTQHNGQFNTLHDAGAAVGIHTRHLAKRFDKVVVTDASEENIRIAQQRLPAEFQIQKVKLEDTIDFPAASIDMVYAGTMMHYTDLDRAVEAVAHQLKPGGTFAMTCVGAAFLTSQPGTVWPRMYQAGLRQVLRSNPESKNFVRSIASGYDAIPLPEKYFHSVRRIKLNFEDHDWYNHHMPPEYAHELPHWSQIGTKDMIKHEVNDEWKFRTDMNGLKDHMATMAFDQGEDDVVELWKELEEIIGDGQVDGVFPACLVLATRT